MNLDFIKKNISLIDVALYVIIVGLMWYCLKMERSDISCPYVGCDKSLCREGNGTQYQGVDPEEGDTAADLGKKIIKAGSVHRKTVYWRRSLLITFLGLIILWMVLFRRLPNGSELVTGMFILGAMWYFSFNFYNYHHFDHAYHKSIDLVKLLVERCDGQPIGLKTF